MAEQEPEPGFPFAVDLGHNGIHEFPSLASVHDWLSREQSFYSWVRGDATNPLRGAWEPLRSALANRPSRLGPEFAKQVESCLTRFARSAPSRPGEYLHSGTPEAQWLVGLDSLEVQNGALTYFLQLGQMPASERWIAGHTRALLYDIGVRETAQAERQALSELRLKAASDLEAMKAEWSGFLESSRGDAAKHNETLGNFVRRAELDTGQRQSDFNGIIQGFKGRIQDLEETYEKKLALNAPVLYWTNRAKHHKSRAFIFGGLTLALMIAGAGGLWWVASSTFGGLKEAATWADVQHWKLIALAFYVTLFLWILRLSVRIFLSNVHLETDAQERKVMMEAYLALLREQGLNKDGDRAIALSALFRPSATGVVDDAGPNTPFDLLSRLLGKSS